MNQRFYNQPDGDAGAGFFPYYGPSYPPFFYYFPPFPDYTTPAPPASFPSGGVNKTAIITPAVVAGIALLGSAVLLVSYYKVFARYFSAWHMFWRIGGRGSRVEEYRNDESSLDQAWMVHSMNAGLDESVVKQIPVLVFQQGNEAILGSNECAVCLGEFEELDHLRILPKCTHPFHLSCIDVWLRSHSNCPLCRAPVVPRALPVESVSMPSEEAPRSASAHIDEEEENERRNRLRAVLRRSYSTGTNPPSYHECFLKGGTEFVLTDIRIDSSSSPSSSSLGNPDTGAKPGFFKSTLKRSLSTGARIFSLRSATRSTSQTFDSELHSA